jgi:prepilin-type N-terminal cleavage/methylation domain-containing protein/prepilin-type processing-associated H-X9-DG protein
MNRSPLARPFRSTHRRGFTLIELLVVIAIIAILAAILFPVFAQAREAARKTSCMNNCKQIAIGTMQYVQDYDETFPKGWQGYPAAIYWFTVIDPYIKSSGVTTVSGIYKCPSWTTSTGASRAYGWNIGCNDTAPAYANGFGYYPLDGSPYRTLAEINRPSDTIFCGDISQYPSGSNQLYIVWVKTDQRYTPARHQEGANYCFADGHAKWMKQNYAWSNRDLFNATKQ